jgi:hypothetical protein
MHWKKLELRENRAGRAIPAPKKRRCYKMKKFIEAKNKKEAIKQAEGFEIIKKVSGGYIAFKTTTDYETWKNQK